jgi:hypothetical protein
MDVKTIVTALRDWVLLCRPAAGTCLKANRQKLNRKGAPTCTVEEVDVSEEDSSQSELGLPDANTDLDVNPHDKDIDDYAEVSDYTGDHNSPPLHGRSNQDVHADDGITEILTQR